MILLDKSTHPNKTIIYISAVIYGFMILKKRINIDEVYNQLQNKIGYSVNYTFFILALNFLYLLGKIKINKKGEIEVVH